jgi:two-component system cell cycle sensor histidine kinase/response regulator CckA
VNARDAMPAGGTLTIGTSRLELPHEDEDCNPPGVPPGDYVVLQVADTGIGMTLEVLNKVFEPFFTTKPVGEGTGLGLSTVYGIVQQSNGFVAVESEPGNGTSFRIFLPRVLQRGGAASEVPPEPGDAGDAGRRARILLVEDDDGVRQLTARMLRQYGYDILVATDGTEALAMLASGLQGVDAVVTDVVMPGMSGAELIGQLRARWPDLPVLFLSGYTGDEVKGELKSGSRQAFLQKPFSSDALAAAVEEMLSDVRPPATAG